MTPRSQMKVAMTYGAMLGLAGIIVYLLFYFAGAEPQNKWPGYIGYVLMIITIVMCVKSYRDQDLGGYISYGRSLGTGVLIGLFDSIIAGIFTIIMFTVIDPDLPQKMLDITQQRLAEKGSMTEEQMEMAMTWTRKMMSPPIMFCFAILGTVLMATIFSLIISIFMKRDKNPFETTTSAV